LNSPLGKGQRARPDVLLEKLTDQSCAVETTVGDPADTPAKGTPLQPEEDKRRRAVRKGQLAQFPRDLELDDRRTRRHPHYVFSRAGCWCKSDTEAIGASGGQV
jgi:hypothetical protein